MLKKTIQYEDFNGDRVSEDYYFHLSQAELVELEMSFDGGLSESLKKIIEKEDGGAIITEFKKIILMAYGKRSDDGRRFIKNQDLRDEFESSEAYSTLFMELITDADAAIEFVNGIVPKNLVDKAEAAAKLPGAPVIAAVPPSEPEVISRSAIQEMSQEDLAQLGRRISSGEVTISEV